MKEVLKPSRQSSLDAARSLVVVFTVLGAVLAGPEALPVPLRLLTAGAIGVALFWTASRATRVLLGPAEIDALSRLTITGLFAAALCIVPATILGHFGVLSGRALLTWVLIAFVASRVFSAPVDAAQEPSAPRPPFAERFILAGAVAAMTMVLALAIYDQRHRPPGANAYDDASYHLPAAATWRHSGDLRMLKFPIGDGSMAFYPIAGELASFALLAPMGNIDVFARVSEAPFALFSLIAVAAIARRLGLPDGAAVLAALLYATNPRAFPTAMLSAGNDHATAFFALAAVLASLLLGEHACAGRAVTLGIALGLLAGTKYTGLMFALPIGILAGLCVLGSRDSGTLACPSLRRILALAAIALGVSLFCGGYTYLRNAVATSNPLYPADVKLLGTQVLKGWAASARAGFRAREEFPIDVRNFLTGRPDLFGSLFPWIAIPAACLAPVVALFVNGSPWERLRRALLFSLPAVFFAQFLFLMFDHRDVRYIFAAVALAGLGTCWLIERLPPRAARTLRTCFVAAVAISLALHQTPEPQARAWLLGGAGLTGLFFAVRPAGFLAPSLRRWATVGAIALLVAWTPTVAEYQNEKFASYQAAAFLDAATGPRGTTVAFVGGNQPYGFFGGLLQNRVLFVPTFADAGAAYFGWKGSLQFPRHLADRSEWRQNLRRLGVEYAVVVRHGDDMPERGWMAIEPDAFRLVCRDARTEVFSVNVPETPSPSLTLDPERPETDRFLGGGVGRLVGSANERAFFHVSRADAMFVIPPLGSGSLIDSITIELATAPGQGLALVLNGSPLPLEKGSPLARKWIAKVPHGRWRFRRNWLSFASSDDWPPQGIRIARIELAMLPNTTQAPARPGSLLVSLELPEAGATLEGQTLFVKGWCQERGGGRIEPASFLVDGLERPVKRLIRVARPDVSQVIPSVGDASEAGFEAEIDVSDLATGEHELVVGFETPDGRARTLPARKWRR